MHIDSHHRSRSRSWIVAIGSWKNPTREMNWIYSRRSISKFERRWDPTRGRAYPLEQFAMFTTIRHHTLLVVIDSCCWVAIQKHAIYQQEMGWWMHVGNQEAYSFLMPCWTTSERSLTFHNISVAAQASASGSFRFSQSSNTEHQHQPIDLQSRTLGPPMKRMFCIQSECVLGAWNSRLSLSKWWL